MANRDTLLAVFAHPDDESLVAGGTLAQYASEGWQTALICATRGEWGPISDESLADYENLGKVREGELRAACEALGISGLQFLDIDDGGVGLLDVDEQERTLEKIVRAVRQLQPRLIITFGPDGLYGHDDHIAIGGLTTAAREMAADPNAFPEHLKEGLAAHRVPELHYATAPHGYYSNLVARLTDLGHDVNLWGLAPKQFGIPAKEITITVDIRPFLDSKLAALRCHRTQLDESHAFTHLTAELAAELFGSEFFYSHN